MPFEEKEKDEKVPEAGVVHWVIAEPATEAELVTEWILPGGACALLSPFEL